MAAAAGMADGAAASISASASVRGGAIPIPIPIPTRIPIRISRRPRRLWRRHHLRQASGTIAGRATRTTHTFRRARRHGSRCRHNLRDERGGPKNNFPRRPTRAARRSRQRRFLPLGALGLWLLIRLMRCCSRATSRLGFAFMPETCLSAFAKRPWAFAIIWRSGKAALRPLRLLRVRMRENMAQATRRRKRHLPHPVRKCHALRADRCGG